jgi:AsmA-like C-terminal region/AsmA family
MRALKIALITIAAAVLLIVAAAFVLFATLSDDSYRRIASYLFERATGRTLIVDGRFAVHRSLRPSLVMSHVRIPNPAWASAPDLAQIGHFELEIALPSLLSGTLVIERLILEDANFALERRADGTANWTMGQGGPGPGVGLVPVLGTVRLRNVAWQYRDDASGDETAVQLARLTLDSTGAAGQLDGQGTWDGQAISAKGTLGTLAEALDPTRPFPLDLTVSLPGLALDLRGTIAEPAAGRGLELRLAGHSDDIAPFLERLDSRAPLAGPAEGEATLRGNFDALQIPDLRLTVGDPATVAVKGAIATVRPGELRPLEGIALELAGSTTTAGLTAWLGRPLPDLGPIAGQLKLSGTSEALSVTGLKIQAGAAGGPTVGVSGDIAHMQLAPAFAVRGADLQLAAAAPDLAALGTMLEVSLPPRPLSYTGRLSGASDWWTLSGEAQLGDTPVTHSFTGSITGAPPRLAGELSAALAGLELTARGTVADLIEGQGLDLHMVGHADDVAPFLRLFGSDAPLRGRLTAQGTLGGNLAALQVTGLRFSLDQGASSTLQATGQIASVTPGGTTLLDGIALEVQGTAATAVLAGWLGRPLPDLGPIQGRFTLSGSSRAVALTDLQLQAGTADRLRIAATGSIAEIRLEPPTVRSPDLNLNATARDGTIIGAVLEADVPRLGALAYTGRLSGERARWQLTGQARVGRTVIDQDLAIEHEHARPRISGTLSIPTLYLADFGFGSKGARSEQGAPPSLDAALGALDAVDLALHVGLGEVEGAKLPIGRGDVDLELEDGVLRIDPARFGFVAGTTVVHATANARAQPPQTDLNATADDIQLGEVVTAMGGTPPLTGELALLLKLQSRGDSAQALLSALNGEAHFAIQRGDVDISVNLATADLVTWLLAGAQRGAQMLRGADKRTKLKCLVGQFTIRHGVATAQSLLMTTPLTHSTATGTINLVDQTIDLVVHFRARQAAMFDPATTYRIHGPMTDPVLDFSKTGFVARAITNLVMKPIDALGALLPLVADDGGDPGNPCLSAED